MTLKATFVLLLSLSTLPAQAEDYREPYRRYNRYRRYTERDLGLRLRRDIQQELDREMYFYPYGVTPRYNRRMTPDWFPGLNPYIHERDMERETMPPFPWYSHK